MKENFFKKFMVPLLCAQNQTVYGTPVPSDNAAEKLISVLPVQLAACLRNQAIVHTKLR